MQMLRIVPDGALSWRDAFLALALVAALIRSLVPAGFMPASDETGAVRMVICTVGGAKTLDGAARAPTDADGAMASSQSPCAFAALALLAPPPSALILSLAVSIEAGATPLDETRLVAAASNYRPQAQRAPPVLQT